MPFRNVGSRPPGSTPDQQIKVYETREVAMRGIARDPHRLDAPARGHRSCLNCAFQETLLPGAEPGDQRRRNSEAFFLNPEPFQVLAWTGKLHLKVA